LLRRWLESIAGGAVKHEFDKRLEIFKSEENVRLREAERCKGADRSLLLDVVQRLPSMGTILIIASNMSGVDGRI